MDRSHNPGSDIAANQASPAQQHQMEYGSKLEEEHKRNS